MTNKVCFAINDNAYRLAELMMRDSEKYNIDVKCESNGVRILDAGLNCKGSILAGIKIAEICMGGLGNIALGMDYTREIPNTVYVNSSVPVIACLSSQYAGWSLNVVKEDNGGKPFNCLGSGPARVLANREDLIKEIAYSEISHKGVLILEVASYPPRKIIDKIINDCRLNPENLVLIITPTTSLAGTTQVVSRVLEVAMHKLHALKFPLQNVVEGFANAPLPLPSNDFLEAMGRTNDAILYGGLVQLVVSGNDSESEKLAKALPSSNSQDYGKSFSDIFKSVSYDFYKIDPMLFAPAKVIISNLDSGKSWVEGSLNLSLLEELWIETEN